MVKSDKIIIIILFYCWFCVVVPQIPFYTFCVSVCVSVCMHARVLCVCIICLLCYDFYLFFFYITFFLSLAPLGWLPLLHALHAFIHILLCMFECYFHFYFHCLQRNHFSHSKIWFTCQINHIETAIIIINMNNSNSYLVCKFCCYCCCCYCCYFARQQHVKTVLVFYW